MRNLSPSPSIRIAKMLCGLLCAAFLLASCSTTDVPNYGDEELQEQFVDYGRGALTQKAFSPIRVFMAYERSTSSSDRNRFKDYVEDSIMTWLEPLRTMPNGSRITRDVIFTTDRNSSHIDVVVKNENGSSHYIPARFGSTPTINMMKDDQYTEGVWLHEFGHAFGLGDTYIGFENECIPGQYDRSVMCGRQFTKLLADDIRGIRHEYCKRYSYCDSRDYLDMYGGSGGTPFTYDCPGSKVLYGLEVRHGSVIDSVRALCRYTNGNNASTGPRYGGRGGYKRVIYKCSGTSYVTDIRVRAGWRVDSVELRCSNGTRSSRIGGRGGSLDKVYACPRSSNSDLHYPAVKGIRVRSGSVIDSLGLTCSKANGNLY